MHIELVPGTECPEDIRSLFTEYTRMLVSECPGFARYLEMQDFDSELLNLDKKYSPPAGSMQPLQMGLLPAAADSGRLTA